VSLALYTDENVLGAIVSGLRCRGVDVLTVVEDGRSGIPDPEVLDRATALSRLLFSQDDDLLREAKKRQEDGEAFVGVVYGHILRVSVGRAIEDLEIIAGACELTDFANRVEYLPL